MGAEVVALDHVEWEQRTAKKTRHGPGGHLRFPMNEISGLCAARKEGCMSDVNLIDGQQERSVVCMCLLSSPCARVLGSPCPILTLRGCGTYLSLSHLLHLPMAPKCEPLCRFDDRSVQIDIGNAPELITHV